MHDHDTAISAHGPSGSEYTRAVRVALRGGPKDHVALETPMAVLAALKRARPMNHEGRTRIRRHRRAPSERWKWDSGVSNVGSRRLIRERALVPLAAT